MDIILTDTNTKAQLLIDHQEGSVGLTVLIPSKTEPMKWQQLDFSVGINEWEHIKTFIDDQHREYQREQREKSKTDKS